MSESISKQRYVYSLLATLALFLFLQLTVIDREALFVDEVDERIHAQGDVQTILFQPDSMPPLYNLALKAWLGLWDSPTSTRWLSVLFACGVIAALWKIGDTLNDRRVGLIAILLLSLSPFFSYYAHLTRGYALFCMVASIETGMILHAIQSGKRRSWIAAGIACSVGSYTHYYNAFVVATLYGVGLAKGAKDRTQLRNVLVSAILFAIVSLPCAFLVYADFAYQKNIREPRPISLATIGYAYESLIAGFSIGPSWGELQIMKGTDAMVAIAPWAPLFVVALVPLVWFGVRRLRRASALAVHVGLLSIPMLAIVGVSKVMGLNFNVRFIVWMVVPLMWLLAAGIVEGWDRWSVRLGTMSLLCIFAVSSVNRWRFDRYHHEDLRSISRTISELHRERGPSPVFVTSDYLAPVVKFYLGESVDVVELPDPDCKSHVVEDDSDAQRAVATLTSIVRQRAVQSRDAAGEPRRFFWVYSRPFHGDPKGILKSKLAEQFKISEVATGAGVILFEGHLPAEPLTIGTSDPVDLRGH